MDRFRHKSDWTHFERIARGTSVVVGILFLVLPYCLLAGPDTVTFTGDQSSGISVISPPVLTVNVNNLSGSIHPGPGVDGISLSSNAAGNLTINSGVVGTPVGISTNGDGAIGISIQNTGVPSATTTDPLLGIPVLFHLDSNGHPVANSSVAGGVVTIISYSNITTTGNNAHGISGISDTTGYPSSVTQQITNFNPSSVAFSVSQVSGSSGAIGHAVSGQRVDIDGNPVAGGGGQFTMNTDGSYTFNPGTDFNGIGVGGKAYARLQYAVSGSNSTSHVTGSDQGTLIVQVTLQSAVTDPNTHVTTYTFSQTGESQFAIYGTSSTALPDLAGFQASQLLFAGAGGAGGVVNVTSNGAIQTSGVNSHGISAASEGGNGGNGRDGSISHGSDQGGPGQTGGKVTVTADGTINILENVNSVTPSSGVFAISTGGQGGNGGAGGTFRYGSLGGAGGDGGQAIVLGDATIHTYDTKSIGILAVSAGGNAGSGGSGAFVTGGASGGFGGKGGDVSLSGTWNITTQGNQAYGIWAKSTGGNGGQGGSGGWLAGSSAEGGPGTTGGTVIVSSGGRLETFGQHAYGIFGESVGGFGGGGGASGIFVSYAADANAGGSGGDVTLNNLASGTIVTHGTGSHAIFGQSVGGSGGTGGSGDALVSIGGSGAAGGNGGSVEITNDGSITTYGAASRGIYAQSVGGGGGDGGNTSGLVAIGGDGSSTSDGGTVKVRNGGNISTTSNALFAQSVGGGGGNGGSGSGWFSLGGSGGSGGNGNTVTVTSHGVLNTSEDNATAIFAQSLGGGGGNGGSSTAVGAFVSVAIGGSGATGGTGAQVTVGANPDNNSAIDPVTGRITTLGDNANGIQAQSVGGGGGNGGFARSVAVGVGGAAAIGLGGNGGGGNSAEDVDVYYGNGSSVISTAGKNANGIFAQSVGGGGGSGGMSIALGVSDSFSAALSFGGSGAGGGNAGLVHVGSVASPLLGQINTTGEHSYGILAQSVGGGGGNGGMSIAGNFNLEGGVSLSFGGSGAQGGTGSGVTVYSQSTVSTAGDNSHGVFAQSLGGGGGSGGGSIAGSLSGGATLNLGFGGTGGGGGGAGEVDVTTGGPSITTDGNRSYGILAQSIGGGGGDGGFSVAGSVSTGPALNFAMGGSGGNGGGSGVVNLTNSSSVGTIGNDAHGIFAQSVGGGGGSGGLSVGAGLSSSSAVDVGVGGSGGGGGDANAVNLASSGSSISTQGDHAFGIFAQSVGGGGGDGGFSVAGGISRSASVNFGVGGKGGNGGSAQSVGVINSSQITTLGAAAHGLVAQSVGGGGGNGGFAIAGSVSTSSGGMSFSIGGKGGTAGNGNQVTVNSTGNIATGGTGAALGSGTGSYGILAQSIGGGGGNGGFSGSFTGALGSSGNAMSLSIGGNGGGGGAGQSVSVTNGGEISTTANDSTGIFAQSIGGGGGNGGFSLAAALTTGSGMAAMDVSIGGNGGTGGNGSTVDVTTNRLIQTLGDHSYGIFAQSVGGGGGNGGFGISTSAGTGQEARSLSVSLGGKGGIAGDASTVTVTYNAAVSTTGSDASAILAQSIGGGGGNGGFSFAGSLAGVSGKSLAISIGGSGGGGGIGGTVNVLGGDSNDIATSGDRSNGILAQSIGGGGGNGGFSVAATLGVGGPDANKSSTSISVSVGGGGGIGNRGGAVNVGTGGNPLTGNITTTGSESIGVLAQSIGGGGGNGGFSLAGSINLAAGQEGPNNNIGISVGGKGGTANDGGAVVLHLSGTISTSGDGSHGVEAQSIGGGGGNGGSARAFTLQLGSAPTPEQKDAGDKNKSLSLAIGGNGSGGGAGGSVSVNHLGDIVTGGGDAYGIFAQSIGGGGGTGGDAHQGIPGQLLLKKFDRSKFTKNLKIVVGGQGGSSGDGGIVVISNTGAITTYGAGSHAVFAQSIGGGGGTGGNGDVGFLGTIGVGGGTGSTGDGKDVSVTINGTLATHGDAAHGIFAQSIGGGGGAAGNVDRGLKNYANLGIGLAFGQGGGNAGSGGTVTINSTADITTNGTGAYGVFAQSIGGGGGVVGSLGNDLPLLSVLNFAGSVGGDGSGGVVNVAQTGTIRTLGDASDGIFAQSAGGKDFGNDVNVTLNSGSILAQGMESNGVLAQSRGDKGGGDITITIADQASLVQGGSNTGVGVRFMDGVNNTLTNHGTITTLGVIAGTAILGGTGNEVVSNDGTVIGSVDLGGGTNTFHHNSGALLKSGSMIKLGTGNLFTNAGTISPGDIGNLETTELTGNFVQTGDAIWFFDITPAFTSDLFAISGSASLGSYSNTVNLNELNVPINSGTYTLITAASGMSGKFQFGTLSGSTMPVGQTFTLVNSDTQEQLTLLPSTGRFYWLGAIGNAWNDPFINGMTDWTSDEAGNNPIYGSPGVACDVFFSSTNSAITGRSTVLGADFTVNSITFNDPNPVRISGSNTLTIAAAGGAGITVNEGAGADTISADIILAANQTWTNDSFHPLTVDGALITGSGKNLTVAGLGTTEVLASIQTGSGSLTKIGQGALVLLETNTYSGGTTGYAGLLLIVNGSALGTGEVRMAGGVIRTLNNPSTLPNTPLYLKIGGNYTQEAPAIIQTRIIGPSGVNDRLVVAGTAKLDGTFIPDYSAKEYNPIPPAGNYSDAFMILQASGGVTGHFSSYIDPHYNPNYLLRWEPVYEPHDVMLEWNQHPFSDLPNLTVNQKSVANALDDAMGIKGSGRPIAYNKSTGPALKEFPDMRAGITFLNTESLANLPRAFDMIAPEELSSIFEISRSYAGVTQGNIEHRLENLRNGEASGFSATGFNLYDEHGAAIALADLSNLPLFASSGSAMDDLRAGSLCSGLRKSSADGRNSPSSAPGNPWGVFVTGNGEFVHVGGEVNSAGYKLNTSGVTVGADYRAGKHCAMGLFGSYADTASSLVNNGSLGVNSGMGGLYATLCEGGFYLNALTAWSANCYETRRLGLNGFATGNTEGWGFDGMLGAGYDAHVSKLTFGPVVSVRYTRVAINGFDEAGSDLPLHVESQSQDALNTRLGLKASYDWKIGKTSITPEAGIQWQHEYFSQRYPFDSRFASGAGHVFTVYGPDIGRDSAIVNAGFNIQWTQLVGTYLYYEGDLFGVNYHSHSISGGIRLNF